ncbi:MAG: hypothetical protein R6V77_00090, partial [Candidatus Cloacimonadaceae bacterium]
GGDLMKFVLAAVTAAMLAIGSIPASAQTAPPLDPENTLYLDLFCITCHPCLPEFEIPPLNYQRSLY